MVRGRTAVIFEFTVECDKARQGSSRHRGEHANNHYRNERSNVDRPSDYRELRVESEATEIGRLSGNGGPSYHRLRLDIDQRREISSSTCFRRTPDRPEAGRSFETKNLIRFTNYQKYGTNVIIGPEDSEPVSERSRDVRFKSTDIARAVRSNFSVTPRLTAGLVILLLRFSPHFLSCHFRPLPKTACRRKTVNARPTW